MQVTNTFFAPPEPRFQKRQFSPEVLKEERLAQGNAWLNNGGRHSRLPLKNPRGSSGIQCDLSWWKCRKWYFNNIVMTFQYKRQYKNWSEAIHSIRGSKRQLLNSILGRDLSPVSINSFSFLKVLTKDVLIIIFILFSLITKLLIKTKLVQK